MIALLAALPAAAAQQHAPAQEAEKAQQITLKVSAPTGDDVFACHIPVSISYPESLKLKKMTAIAKTYIGNRELASTGIRTGERPLVRDAEPTRVEYRPVPLQFGLSKEQCEDVTGLGVMFASCTFENGETENCLDRLRITPRSAGGVAFFIGEPTPPAE